MSPPAFPLVSADLLPPSRWAPRRPADRPGRSPEPPAGSTPRAPLYLPRTPRLPPPRPARPAPLGLALGPEGRPLPAGRAALRDLPTALPSPGRARCVRSGTPPQILEMSDNKDAVKQEGVRVKMLTGDQLAIAKETARRLGMGHEIYLASVLSAEKEGPAQGQGQGQGPGARPVASRQEEALVEEADGFAQVFPEHKHRIVSLLQALAHRVGMTGDGVNDAPALRKADIGIAVSGATDAARSGAPASGPPK
eukprot:tig00000381_g24527.t1